MSAPAEVADRYYQPSGRVPFTGTLIMLTLGVAGAFVLAPLYAWSDIHAGFDKLRLCVMIFYAGLVGGWVYLCSYLGKVRNRLFAGLVGLVIGCFAVYFAWTWFLCAYFDWEFGFLTMGPQDLWETIQQIAQHGLWEKKGVRVSETELKLWWSGEALGIVATAACLAAQQSRPFCEACGRWTAKTAGPAMGLPMTATLKQDLEAEKYEELKKLIRLPAAGTIQTKATLYSCPDCDDSHYLDLGVVSTNPENAQGYQIVKHLSIPPDVAGWVKDPSIVMREAPAEEASQTSEVPTLEAESNDA